MACGKKRNSGGAAACAGYGRELWGRVRDAGPIILFNLVLSLLVMELFGTEYLMTTAGITAIFQSRRDRENRLPDFAGMFCLSLLLCALALAATLHVGLCILLNLAVPFALVLLQSNQFAPKGYFPYAMCFVFQELRPPQPSAFGIQLLVTAFCTLALILALLLHARWVRRPASGEEAARQSLLTLAGLLDRMADGEVGEPMERALSDLEKSLHTQAAVHRTDWDGGRWEKVFDLLGTLVQRAAYLASDAARQEGVLPPEHQEVLRQLSGLLREVEASGGGGRAALLARAQALLADTELPDGRLRIFYRGFLRTLILLLQRAEPAAGREALRPAFWALLGSRLRDRIRLDSFQGRFALRLAVVMTVSCTVSMLWDVERSYWFPLHAFLLLQPSYEDSARRMRTRPIGTALGCLLVSLVYPHLPGTYGAFAFAFFMSACMYCATPGTWNQPIFATAFALTMASMTTDVPVVVYYRLFCLLLAIALVLLVNRFLLPTRRVDQLRRNLKTLLLLHRQYWDIIRVTLREPVDLAVTSEILTQFHLIYEESLDDLAQSGLPDQETCRALLLTLWRMFSELEQIEYGIQTGAVEPEEYLFLDALAEEVGERTYPPQPGILKLAPRVTFQEETVNGIFRRYMENLLQMVRLYSSDACQALRMRHGPVEEILSSKGTAPH